MYRQIYVAQDTNDKTMLRLFEYIEIEGFTDLTLDTRLRNTTSSLLSCKQSG